MGRSVNYLNRASGVIYINHEVSEDVICEYCGNDNTSKLDEDNDQGHNNICNDCNKTFEGYPLDPELEWDFFTENIEDILKNRIPSLDILDRKHSRWEGNEVRIFAENKLVEFGISEYCGLVSISVRPIDNEYSWGKEGLAINWIQQTWPGLRDDIIKSFPKDALYKIGTFSNGEGVYQLLKQD